MHLNHIAMFLVLYPGSSEMLHLNTAYIIEICDGMIYL